MKTDQMEVPQPLFVRSFGQGERRVLALHCTLAHSGAWRGLSAQMAGEVTLTTPDMLSHGRSPDWDCAGDVHDRMTDALLPHLDGPMDLVGHSFGATLALRLAQRCPERTRSLCLYEPVLIAAAGLDDPGAVARQGEEEREVYEALARGDEALGARLFNRRWSDGGPRWPEMAEPVRAALIRGIHILPAGRATIYEDRPGLLDPAALARLRMPVTLVSGENTQPVIKAVNHALATRMADAVEEVVQGAGHMVPVTHPAESAAILRRLFARAPGQGQDPGTDHGAG